MNFCQTPAPSRAGTALGGKGPAQLQKRSAEFHAIALLIGCVRSDKTKGARSFVRWSSARELPGKSSSHGEAARQWTTQQQAGPFAAPASHPLSLLQLSKQSRENAGLTFLANRQHHIIVNTRIGKQYQR